MGEGRELTPKEEIAALIGEEAGLRRKIEAFEDEDKTRLMSIEAHKEGLQRELGSIDSDLEPKEVVAKSKALRDKYKEFIGELNASGEAIDGAIADITQKVRAVSGKRGALEAVEHRAAVDKHCDLVFKEFDKFMRFYSVVSGHFYRTLLPMIEQGYNLDRRFHARSQEIGLSKEIYQAVDSLFRPGSLMYADKEPKLNLAQTLTRLQDMKLDSLFSAEPHPEQDSNQASLWPEGEAPIFSDL